MIQFKKNNPFDKNASKTLVSIKHQLNSTVWYRVVVKMVKFKIQIYLIAETSVGAGVLDKKRKKHEYKSMKLIMEV